jgi:hypothetical protein
VTYARKLADRVADELDVDVYTHSAMDGLTALFAEALRHERERCAAALGDCECVTGQLCDYCINASIIRALPDEEVE